MGATASTQQITVNILTGDGNGGYWWVAVDGNARAYQINYAGPNDIVRNTATLYHFNTFLSLLAGMVTNNVSLPQVEVNINLDSVSDRESLDAQFDLSPQQLDSIAANFNVVNLCKLFGVFPLVRGFYQNGDLSLAQLADVLIYLGQQRKITRQKVEQVTGVLLMNGDVTQAQYDAFWVDWDNQVGI